ncbi:MAG TPA: biopolymer transporter ExbD [Gemmataceae bacterium]|nr:biopolymer transporter ExbD [Gemmataceae bacterium]
MAGKRRIEASVDVEINKVITPMLDMAFQIFAFFIVIYHPSQLEGQLLLSLPDAAQAKAAKPEDARPDQSMPGELELPAEITVLAKTKRPDGTQDGSITQISVQERLGTKDVVKQDPGSNDVPNLEALRKYLQSVRSSLSNQNDIKIEAESGLRYEYVMEIMDMCTRAGFKNVGFAPPPDRPE